MTMFYEQAKYFGQKNALVKSVEVMGESNGGHFH